MQRIGRLHDLKFIRTVDKLHDVSLSVHGDTQAAVQTGKGRGIAAGQGLHCKHEVQRVGAC